MRTRIRLKALIDLRLQKSASLSQTHKIPKHNLTNPQDAGERVSAKLNDLIGFN